MILQPVKDDENKKLVIHAIAASNLSFNILNKPEFKRILNPAIRVYDESHVRRTILPQCALGMKHEIAKVLDKAGTLSASTDLWTQNDLAVLGCVVF